MELFDILMLLAAFTGAITLLWTRLSGWLPWILGVLIISGLLHALLEGLRWQMVPGYVGALMLAGILFVPKNWVRSSLAVLVMVLFGGSAFLSWAFPIFDLPRPDGGYAVGTTEAMFVDSARGESYTTDPTDVRRLMLRIWYPAKEGADSKVAMYWEEPFTRSRAVAGSAQLPWFIFSHLGIVKTFSRWQAPVADGSFPVVIYSHGVGIGWASGNTLLVERLASHGYIVVGIEHAYIGSAAIFPDGVAFFDEATGVALNTQPPEDVREIYGKVPDATSADEQLRLYMQAMSMMPISIKGKIDEALHTQVADQKALLQNLAGLETPGVDLAPRLDTSQVGLIGMSLGGSAAIIACENDPICKAVINLDGFHPDQANVELPVPSMSMHRPRNMLLHANYENSTVESYLLGVQDTTHFNFFDFAIMSPLYRRLGVIGELDGSRGLEIASRFALEFFNESLKGETPTLLKPSRQSEFPEVSLRRRALSHSTGDPVDQASQ